MTGTAMTEANEFMKIYGLDVVAVPTNRPMQRINHPDAIYRTEKEKWDAVIGEIREVHQSGRPILVGTVSIEKSELLSNKLGKYGIDHKVLNAKYHEREAEFVAQAGRLGAVTIATNMAGRGTDIILGGNPEHMAWEELKDTYESRLEVPKTVWDQKSTEIAEREGMKAEGRKVAETGGLHVIGTERHDARRIDLQLRGRSGRQGDPGSSRFFLSLQDDLMRIFFGEWVQGFLARVGMEEGESIESSYVSKQIEKAQKRVEERHFESRKNLLEYDEVMDHQRKSVYGYRQRILDGANCRDLLLGMIDRQIDLVDFRPDEARILGMIDEAETHRFRHFLTPGYRWDIITAYARRSLGITIEPSDVRDMTREQLVDFLKDEMRRQAENQIDEQIEENLPDGDDRRDWNWQALSQWANRQFGLNTSDRELRKIGLGESPDAQFDRSALFNSLNERAQQAIERFDYSDVDTLLADDFPHQQLAGWLKYQYDLEIDPAEFARFEESSVVKKFVREKLREKYRQQEIKFPVSVGMTRFLGGHGTASDKEGLIQWANGRFHSSLSPADLKEKERAEIEQRLLEASRQYFPQNGLIEQVDEYLDRAYESEAHSRNGHLANGHHVSNKQALIELVTMARSQFGVDLEVDDLVSLDREGARRQVLQYFDRRFRPELGHAERAVLLDVLDHAWKEHLYFMDHLRQGIGLVGYAQKDPKTEYKRQGMKAFEGMWDRIGEDVTRVIFRLEQESPQFVGNLWAITGTTHQEAASVAEEFGGQPQQSTQQREPGQQVQTIEPIRNRQDKVGRNDPCPCGSGKKYKKCCGAN
jgi:preprotein translocase subunit SecA